MQQVWNDLIKLTSDQDSEVRYAAASFLGAAAPQVPDKQQAWNDLIKLTARKEKDIRYESASSLSSTFSKVPDKQQAWNDLIGLTSNQDSDVRYMAASFLGSAFSEVPNKEHSWDDLHRLAVSTDVNVRRGIASSLGIAFSKVPDKQQAWDDLHWLVNDTDVSVRRGVASSLGFAFSEVPDKQQAWDDLHRLTLDQDVYVRQRTARFLGSAYPHVPNKQQVWEDLIKMVTKESNDIKALANHSLGKVSIFKASQAENEESYKKDLEEAISFFEEAAQQSTYKWLNPSQFCLPFYRSFNKILFKKQEAKEEVDKYLVEAKNAVKGSKNKEFLFQAIENLSCALKGVQGLEDLDFEAKKGELNSYRIYCDRAAEAIRISYSRQELKNAYQRNPRKSKDCVSNIKRNSYTRDCL